MLDTDASNKQIGRVLLQDQLVGPTKPVGYWTGSLNKVEQPYDTRHGECFAFVWAFLLPSSSLERFQFSVRTDHGDLLWVLT